MSIRAQCTDAGRSAWEPLHYTEFAFRETVKRAVKKDKLHNKQNKALEQLDKMMEEFMEADMPGMCPLSFAPPPNSRSEGNICNRLRR